MTAIGKIIAAGLAAAIIGCAPPHRIAAGVYQGRRQIEGAPGADPNVVSQLSQVKLEVRADQSAVLTDGGLPRQGHIEADGDQWAFVTEAVAGIPIDRQPENVRSAARIPIRSRAGGLEYHDGTALIPQPAGSASRI